MKKQNEKTNKNKMKKQTKFILLAFIGLIIISGVINLFEEYENKILTTREWSIDLFDGELQTFNITYAAKPDKDYSQLDVLIGTPMQDYIPEIIRASEYYELPIGLYLGIANAESSLKRFRCNNPWGIDTGRGNDPRCYSSIEHSVNGFSQLLRYYYFNEGLVTAEQLQRKYVGWSNPDWITNVKKYYE